MIQGVVGLPGQGKSLWMARAAAMDMRRGMRVAANFRLRGADYLPNFAAMLAWCSSNPNGCVYIDEAGVVLNARNWRSVPLEIQILFAQHRHYGLDLIWASQRIGQVDKSLRELSQYITRVRKIWPGFPPSGLPSGGYYLLPIFRADTYESDRLRKPIWTEWFAFSSRWAEMYRTTEIIGADQSSEAELAAGMEAWQRREVSAEGLRIR